MLLQRHKYLVSTGKLSWRAFASHAPKNSEDEIDLITLKRKPKVIETTEPRSSPLTLTAISNKYANQIALFQQFAAKHSDLDPLEMVNQFRLTQQNQPELKQSRAESRQVLELCIILQNNKQVLSGAIEKCFSVRYRDPNAKIGELLQMESSEPVSKLNQSVENNQKRKVGEKQPTEEENVLSKLSMREVREGYMQPQKSEETEGLAGGKAEAAKLEKDKEEQKTEKQKIEKQKIEKQKIEQQKIEQQKIEQQKAEKQRVQTEKVKKQIQMQKAEKQKIDQQKKAQAEQQKKAQAEQQNKAQVEQQNKAQVEQQKKAQVEQQKKAQVEQQKKAQVEQQKKAQLEQQKKESQEIEEQNAAQSLENLLKEAKEKKEKSQQVHFTQQKNYEWSKLQLTPDSHKLESGNFFTPKFIPQTLISTKIMGQPSNTKNDLLFPKMGPLAKEYLLLLPNGKTIVTKESPLGKGFVPKDMFTIFQTLEGPERFIKKVNKLQKKRWKLINGGGSATKVLVFERPLAERYHSSFQTVKSLLALVGVSFIALLGISLLDQQAEEDYFDLEEIELVKPV